MTQHRKSGYHLTQRKKRSRINNFKICINFVDNALICSNSTQNSFGKDPLFVESLMFILVEIIIIKKATKTTEKYVNCDKVVEQKGDEYLCS